MKKEWMESYKLEILQRKRHPKEKSVTLCLIVFKSIYQHIFFTK